jgi:hypothetical protein
MADTPQDQTVIVVGAGFSAALTGGDNPMIGNGPLPTLQRLGKELSQFAHDSKKLWDDEGQFSKKTRCHGLTLLKQTFEAGSNPDTNFEQFISLLASQKSFLEQFLSANRPDLPQNDPHVMDFIIFLMCQYFEHQLAHERTSFNDKFSKGDFLYKVNCHPRKIAFAKGLTDLSNNYAASTDAPMITYVSLNYDGLLESLIGENEHRADKSISPLDEHYLAEVSHEFPFIKKSQFNDVLDFNFRSSKYIPKILKPHGSIHFQKLRLNFKKCIGGSGHYALTPKLPSAGNSSCFRTPINQAEGTEAYVHKEALNLFDVTPFIIPPTLNKDAYLGTDYFNEVLFHVHRAITKARNIVVIGFSLPPSDLHLWAALQSIDWTDKRVFICDIENKDGDAFKNWSRVARGAKVELLPLNGLPCDTEVNIKNFFVDLKKRIQ